VLANIKVIDTKIAVLRKSLKVEADLTQLKEQLVRENLKRVNVLEEMKVANLEASRLFFARAGSTLDAAHFTSQINLLEEAGRQRQEEVRLAEERVRQTLAAFEREQEAMMRLKNAAEDAWENVEEEENQYIQNVRKFHANTVF
jgi:hypothetical protein